MKDFMHVAIEEPNEQRKAILTKAVDVINFLKKLEEEKVMRQEKEVYKKRLKELTLELRKDFKEFSDFLPRVKHENPFVKKKEVKKKVERKADPSVAKLERDLADLKSRIGSL